MGITNKIRELLAIAPNDSPTYTQWIRRIANKTDRSWRFVDGEYREMGMPHGKAGTGPFRPSPFNHHNKRRPPIVEAELTPDELKVLEDGVDVTKFKFNEDKGEGLVEGLCYKRDIDHFIKHCRADLERWYVSEWEAKCWDMGAKVRIDDREEFEVRELWSIRARFKSCDVKKRLWEQYHAISKLIESRPPPLDLTQAEPLTPDMVMISVGEPHIGKYATRREGGELEFVPRVLEYVINEAVEYVRTVRPAEVWIVSPGDFFHYDNFAKTTTKGTPMEGEASYSRMFDAGCLLFDRMIITLLGYVEKIRLKLVRGNHDEHVSFHLGRFLRAAYRNDPRVEVQDNAPKYLYAEFGKTAFMFTHLEVMKNKVALAQRFPVEEPDLWARCQYREIHGGHEHRERQIQYAPKLPQGGAMLYVHPSLSVVDKWHKLNGFFGNVPAAKVFHYHLEKGKTGERDIKIPDTVIRYPE